jgi:uncharacterized damage-inducible protein DinB
MSDLSEHFRLLGRYNRIANENLYTACAALSDSEYRKERFGSFGSVHRTLNHILLGDRIWMSRLEGGGATTPPLGTILYEDFPSLRLARVAEDERIEKFLAEMQTDFLGRSLTYVNSAGLTFRDPVPLAIAHMFNHATHHRGQIHVMLSHAGIKPPSLDLHRAINREAQQ